jgi:hypothetical protein
MWHPLSRESDLSKARPPAFSASAIVMPDSIRTVAPNQSFPWFPDWSRWQAAMRSRGTVGELI